MGVWQSPTDILANLLQTLLLSASLWPPTGFPEARDFWFWGVPANDSAAQTDCTVLVQLGSAAQ